MRIGVVSSLSPLLVNVQGSDIPVGRAASFFPALGETVAIMRQDGTWMIMDRTQGPDDPTQRHQAGSELMSVSAAPSATMAVLFAWPFSSIPAVATNLNSGAAATALWESRAFNISTVGFTLFIFAAAPSTFSAEVQWQAQEMTQ